MNEVNRTLYIPLYGKALVSRRGIILKDAKAEEIWAAEGFALKRKARSKWLAFYMGMRAAVFDRWLTERMEEMPEAVVLHMGCGMDSRVERVGTRGHHWFDVDFPEVITERRRYFQQTEHYKMLCGDARNPQWLEQIPKDEAIVVLEGVSMYLRREELKGLLTAVSGHFSWVCVLMDCYTEFAAKASKVKNPIKDVGVTQVYGVDDPKSLECGGVTFAREGDMTPAELVDELAGVEKAVFRTLYAGGIARKMYRLYEYQG